MQRWVWAVGAVMVLAGCHGPSGDEAAGDGVPSEAEVRAGTTKDSADPRLNALQRTKRKLNTMQDQGARDAVPTEAP